MVGEISSCHFIAYPQGAGLCEHSSTEIGFIGFPFRQNMVWKNESHIHSNHYNTKEYIIGKYWDKLNNLGTCRGCMP